MTDILLATPQKSNKAIQICPPIGLGFLLTYLKKMGHTGHLLDCELKRISPSAFCRSVDLKRYKAIGFNLYTLDMEKVKEYLRVIKKHNKNIITIVGGPQASADPINTLEYLQYADFAVYGEGESSLAEFLNALHNKALNDPTVMKKIPNLIWKYNNKYQINPQQFEGNLDEIGHPDWEEINPRNYDTAVHGFFAKKLPICPIIVTRGCPYNCTFCGGRKITGYKIRTRNPIKVIEEIKLLKYKYGIQEFQIEDDNFTANKKIAMHFCKTLINEKLDMSWNCPNGVRLDTLDDELLDTMQRSGCYEIAVGIESGNQGILNDMNKGTTIELIRKKVNLINKYNINVIGFIMVGYPSETAETIEESRKLALELPLLRVSLTRFIPLPGTPVTEELIKKKKINKEDLNFSKLSYMSFSYIPGGLTNRRLKWLFFKFFVTFYFRPHIIIKNLKGIHSFKQFMLIFKKVLNLVFEI